MATIFLSLFMLCCLAAACSSNNRKRHSTRTHRRTNRGEINTVYSVDTDTCTADFGRYPSPPSPPDSGIPFTPPAGFVPGYVPPLPLDKPPAYETLDNINTVNTSSSSPPPPGSVTIATTHPEEPPSLPIVDTTSAESNSEQN